MFGHYPLFEKEAGEAEAYFNLPAPKRLELVALFKQHGVRAYLTGHTHKQVLNVHDGIRLVSSATTSKNFDKAPRGFRAWRISGAEPLTHEYVVVAGAPPPLDEKK